MLTFLYSFLIINPINIIKFLLLVETEIHIIGGSKGIKILTKLYKLPSLNFIEFILNLCIYLHKFYKVNKTQGKRMKRRRYIWVVRSLSFPCADLNWDESKTLQDLEETKILVKALSWNCGNSESRLQTLKLSSPGTSSLSSVNRIFLSAQWGQSCQEDWRQLKYNAWHLVEIQ